MSAILEVEQLTKKFKGLTAVNGISFKVEKGVCFGLLGPNGAGKTTTIEMLEGIVTPNSGSILYKGKAIDKSIYHQLGIQFQHTALQDHLTVKETLVMFSAFYNDTLPLPELIELCQLHDFLDQDHRKLSGGQKQRLLLALALLNKPDLIFLDEPTTGLDPHSRRLFWQLVNQIKAQGKTIVLTTHYMDEAEYLCDTIAIMDKGQVIALDSPSNLLKQHFSHSLLKLPVDALSVQQQQTFNAKVQRDVAFIDTAEVEMTLSKLISAGVSLTGLQVKSANLDDLFLKLTGHDLGV